jgi:PHD/YefM family antitoxin component YafN of YafNO toxin-antitoxin module
MENPMVNIDLGKDIQSLSDFKRNTSEFVSQMQETGRPLVLTINGQAELIVQDAGAYQELLDHIEEVDAIEGIQRGLADKAAGRVISLEDFEKSFRRAHNLPRRPR